MFFSPVEIDLSPDVSVPELLREIPIVECASANNSQYTDKSSRGHAEEHETSSFTQDNNNNYSSGDEDYKTQSELSSNDENHEPQNNENTPKSRPKKGRKRKFGNMLRSDRKQRKYTNKEYVNYKGMPIAPKEFKDFNCGCTMNCREVLSADKREEEFKKFWELGSYLAQTAFLGTCVKEETKKRSYAGPQSNRNYTRRYSLKGTSVCKSMFLNTLQISSKRVNTSLIKLRSPSIVDRRGKQQGGSNKLSGEKMQEVVNHINRIPRYKSHYNRTKVGDQEFLAEDMTLEKMYSLYKSEHSNPVSISYYRKIFYTQFNIKPKPLKKDTCNVCDAFAAAVGDKSKTDAEKEKLIEDHNEHIKKWRNAQEKMKADLQAAKGDDTIECLTFDLQKTLPLPRIPTNLVFYKRQLWVYNLGIHSGKEDRGYCNVWVEGMAGRGAQEVGSILKKHIGNISGNIRTLVLWADSCGGQNRNIKLVLMLMSILYNHPTIQTVHLRFLISGHSFLPNDTMFGKIESALKYHQRIYLPSEYVDIMRLCKRKNKLIVTELKAEDFLGVKNLEEKITNRKKSTTGETVNWLKTREIILNKNEPYIIKMKQSFEADEVQVLSIEKRGAGRKLDPRKFQQFLEPLWPHGKPINPKKLQNLQEMLHLISDDAKPFYMSLVSDNQVEDDLDGFGVPPDFDLSFDGD